MALPKHLKLSKADSLYLKNKKPVLVIFTKNFVFNFHRTSSKKRFLVIVPKKTIPKATKRNSIRRHLHAIILKNLDDFAFGDYIFIAKSNINEAISHEEIISQVNTFLSKISELR